MPFILQKNNMKNKISFLATGDIHSDLKFLRKIKKKVDFNKIDIILMIGDISDKNKDFGKIFSYFEKKPILLSLGNHETKKKIEVLKNHYKNITILGDFPIKLSSDLAVFGSKFLNLGHLSRTEDEIYNNLKDNFNQIKGIKYKIFLSHIPPSNTTIGDSSVLFPFIGGSEGVRDFIDNHKIDLTLVGHIHESSGLEEIVSNNLVVNVGKTYKIIEFDLEKRKLKLL